MTPTTAPETSSENLPRTPCKTSETENQYSFHGESLKSRLKEILFVEETSSVAGWLVVSFLADSCTLYS
jgi:hypothetical protein